MHAESTPQRPDELGHDLDPLELSTRYSRAVRTATRRVEMLIPETDMQPLHLVDEHEDRPAGRRDLRALVVLEPFGPLVEEPDLLGVEAVVRHVATISLSGPERANRHLGALP